MIQDTANGDSEGVSIDIREDTIWLGQMGIPAVVELPSPKLPGLPIHSAVQNGPSPVHEKPMFRTKPVRIVTQ